MQAQRVGRLVADAVKQPLPDVTRNLRTSKGILATSMPPEQAVELAEKIEGELQESVLVVPDNSCVPAIQPTRMRHITFNENGLECEAYSWDQTEKVEAPWDHVFLVSCGRLELQELVENGNDSADRPMFSRKPLPTLMRVTRHEFLLDVILFDPPGSSANGWRNLRLDQNTAAFAWTEIHQDTAVKVGPLYRSAIKLEPMGDLVPMNRGVSLLSSGTPDSDWEPLTFLNKRDFESYTYWLMQLVRYGRPIPA